MAKRSCSSGSTTGKTRTTPKAAARPKGAGAGRGTGKRELISPKGDARYVRRDAKGRIAESDDVGRSLKQDRARKAKTKTKSGQGDRGDR
jgi:hypothetical protein